MEYLLIIPGRLDNLNDYINACRSKREIGNRLKQENEAVVKAAITRCLRGVRIQKKVRMEYRMSW